MSAVINVRDPRTGMMTPPARDWAEWRRRWERRRMGLRARVRLCPWCWGFGAREMVGGHATEVPCLSCGRVSG